MKKISFAALAVLTLLAAGCARREEAQNLFPMLDKIYAYSDAPGAMRVMHVAQSPYNLSKDFFHYGRYYYFIASEAHTVLRYDPRSRNFQPVFNDVFSKVFLTDRYLVRLSGIFYDNRGFEVKIYRFDTSQGKVGEATPAGFYLDLLVSDFAVIDGKIYLAGSDSRGLRNAVYLLDPASGNARQVLSVERRHDFLKMVASGDFIAVYPSVSSAGQTSGQYWKIGLSSGSVFTVELASPASFFGKGFTAGGKLYVPSISSSNRIDLLCLSDGAVVSRQKLPTGVYAPLKEKDGAEYFIGFNYFADRNAFGLVRFDTASPSAVDSIPLAN